MLEGAMIVCAATAASVSADFPGHAAAILPQYQPAEPASVVILEIATLLPTKWGRQTAATSSYYGGGGLDVQPDHPP